MQSRLVLLYSAKAVAGWDVGTHIEDCVVQLTEGSEVVFHLSNRKQGWEVAVRVAGNFCGEIPLFGALNWKSIDRRKSIISRLVRNMSGLIYKYVGNRGNGVSKSGRGPCYTCTNNF